MPAYKGLSDATQNSFDVVFHVFTSKLSCALVTQWCTCKKALLEGSTKFMENCAALLKKIFIAFFSANLAEFSKQLFYAVLWKACF